MLRVPVLGLIENMSYHQCVACGHKEHTFGQGGVHRTAVELGLDVLGEVRMVFNHFMTGGCYIIIEVTFKSVITL